MKLADVAMPTFGSSSQLARTTGVDTQRPEHELVDRPACSARRSVELVTVVDGPALGIKEPLPGWKGRFFHSERMTFAYYDIDGTAVDLHEHDHPQEEVWHVLDGELAITVDGHEHVVGPGCAVIVPPNARHSARVLGACRALVVDTPRRQAVGNADLST